MAELAPGRPHFALFDSLRGIAVLSVIGFHVAALTAVLGIGPDGRVFTVLGGEAVIVFFVISGFLLYRPYVSARATGREPPSTRTFLHRRVFRIVPAYWVILTAFGVFPGLIGIFDADFWRYYGFLQLYDPDTILSGLPVAWTLSVEVAYYAALPLWAWAVRRIPLPWMRAELLALAFASAGGVIVQLLVARQHIPRTWGDSLLGQFPWLAIGMVLAVASVVGPRWAGFVVRRSALVWLVGIAALAGLATLVPPGGLLGLAAAVNAVRPFDQAVAHIVLSAVLAVAFVLPAVFGEDAGGLPRRLLRLTPVAWFGTVSYSIYLWHLPVAHFIARPRDEGLYTADAGLNLLAHVQTGRTGVLFVLTVAVSAALAAITYYGVERPFIRRSHR